MPEKMMLVEKINQLSGLDLTQIYDFILWMVEESLYGLKFKFRVKKDQLCGQKLADKF